MATVNDFTALLSGTSWLGIGINGQPAIITYSFDTTAPAYVIDGQGGWQPGARASFRSFNDTEKTAARAALGQWSAVSGIELVEVGAGQGEIAFSSLDIGKSPNPDSGGFAIPPTRGFFFSGLGVDGNTVDGDIFIGPNSFLHLPTPSGTSLAYTLLHEIGHSIGLKHPFEGDPTFPGATTTDTVMAYGAAVQVLGTLDDDAASSIYGAPGAAPAGTLLNWNYNAASKVLTQNWGTLPNAIMATGQRDIIDAGSGNDKVAGFENNDLLKGNLGNDELYGGPGNDSLVGGPGDDTLFGGNKINFTGSPEPGSDTADYSASTAAIVVNLRFFSTDTGFQATGAAIGNDTLYDIDNVIGGSKNDRITGDQFANALSGRDGNDILSGSLGNDTLDGGTGNDTLFGDLGADKLIGGTHNDIFKIAGNESVGDTFFGGVGTDKIQVTGFSAVTLTSFARSAAIEQWAGNGKGVLGTGAANNLDFSGLTSATGWGSVNGGDGNDKITGSRFNEKLFGNSGNDTLLGGAQNDILTGGTGKDILTGGANKDIFDFNALNESVRGANRDQIKDFTRGQTDKIDLSTIDADTDGTAGNQKFKFIGTAAFHGIDGELRCSGGIIQGDTNGNKVADFEIKVNLAIMAAGDFLL